MSNVNSPKHYQSTEGKFEVIDVIEQYNLSFSLGNCVKYICRAGKKDASKTIEDLQKAQYYLNRELERLKHESKN